MYLLTRQDIPCWYELSWQEKIPAILLRVHEDFIKDAVKISEKCGYCFRVLQRTEYNEFRR
jgi:hypothetical protein